MEGEGGGRGGEERRGEGMRGEGRGEGRGGKGGEEREGREEMAVAMYWKLDNRL